MLDQSISPLSKYLQTFAFLFDTFFYPLFHPPVDGTRPALSPRCTSLRRQILSRGWKEGGGGEEKRGEHVGREVEDGGEQGREFVPRLSGDNLQNCLARTARHRAIPLVVLSADDPRMIIVPRTGTRYVALPSPSSPPVNTRRPRCAKNNGPSEQQLADLPTNTRQPPSTHQIFNTVDTAFVCNRSR